MGKHTQWQLTQLLNAQEADSAQTANFWFCQPARVWPNSASIQPICAVQPTQINSQRL